MRLKIIGSALFLTLAGTSQAKSNTTADLVFHNGVIYTLDATSSTVDAIAIKDGYITYTGPYTRIKHAIGNSTKIIDLHGRAVIPGLVDAHMHVLSGGLFLLKCDLNYQPLNIDAIVAHIQAYIDNEPEKADDAWVEVVNLDYPSLVTRSGLVNKRNFDILKTVRPVIVRSSDYHTVLVNSRGLNISGISSATPHPAGGIIERLPGGNEPSGVLQDSASDLLVIPPPTMEENVEAGRAALKLLRQAGITTFQEASAGKEHYELFQTIASENGLSSRAYFDYRIEAPKSTEDISNLVTNTAKNIREFNGNTTISQKPSLKWQAIKAFIDGVITYPANTAAVLEPYWRPVNGSNTTWAPDPETLNQPYWRPDILAQTLSGLFVEGIDAQLHVDGDLAVGVGLDAAESFRKQNPTIDFRLGLAHDELSHPDDWGRFAELGVDAIMSFQWAQLSSFYIPSTFKSLADYRLNYLQAYSQIEKAGRPVVYGSDWPIDPLDEFLALKVAVTRSGDPENPNSPASQGPPYDGIFPGEGISREAALRAITINSARFLRADRHIGSLEVGKFADAVVLENDYFKVPESAIGKQRVLLTVAGGEVVYLADEAGKGFQGLIPKFPNNDTRSLKLEKRVVGGFDRKQVRIKGARFKAGAGRTGRCSH